MKAYGLSGGKAWLNLDSFTPKEELPIPIGKKAKDFSI